MGEREGHPPWGYMSGKTVPDYGRQDTTNPNIIKGLLGFGLP